MKKVLLSAFAAAFVCGAHAEEATLDVAALDGFYLGGGLGLYDGGVRTETTDATAAAEIGLDTNDHATELMLSLVAGCGKVFKEKFYFGLEAGADFARNNNFHHEGYSSLVQDRVFSVTSRVNGIIPMVALRFGYVACNTMTYLKAGAFWTKAKTTYNEVDLAAPNSFGPFEGSVSKLTPFVALGCEKAINANMRCRLEAEYRIRTHNDFTYNAGALGNYTVKVENKDAFAVRAYVVRSFSLGN